LLAIAFSLCRRNLCCCKATVSASLEVWRGLLVGTVVSRTPGNQVALGSAFTFGVPVPLPNSTSLAQAIGPVERRDCGGAAASRCLVVTESCCLAITELGCLAFGRGTGLDWSAGCGLSSGSVILSVHSSLSPSSSLLDCS
jgi:hypothetical protein